MASKIKWIKRINYKDIIIIYTLWFFTLLFNRFFDFASFIQIPNLSDFFNFLFVFAARLIFLSLILLYFIFLYDLTFKDLGISFRVFMNRIFPLLIYIILLLALVLLFVNIPLSLNDFSSNFKPLYKVTQIQVFVQSIIPILILFPLFFIIALSEQLMLNLFVYEIFKSRVPKFISKLFSALFFSFLIYQLQPDKIIIYFFFALISVILYERADKSILVPSFFGAGFYLIFAFYIYGWTFI
jgi:membrane protease YdiL (CAAX protease family)